MIFDNLVLSRRHLHCGEKVRHLLQKCLWILMWQWDVKKTMRIVRYLDGIRVQSGRLWVCLIMINIFERARICLWFVCACVHERMLKTKVFVPFTQHGCKAKTILNLWLVSRVIAGEECGWKRIRMRWVRSTTTVWGRSCTYSAAHSGFCVRHRRFNYKRFEVVRARTYDWKS